MLKERRFGSLVLTRLPFRVSPGRFPLSPDYVPSSELADRYGHVDPMTPKDRVKVSDVVSDVDVVL